MRAHGEECNETLKLFPAAFSFERMGRIGRDGSGGGAKKLPDGSATRAFIIHNARAGYAPAKVYREGIILLLAYNATYIFTQLLC